MFIGRGGDPTQLANDTRSVGQKSSGSEPKSIKFQDYTRNYFVRDSANK